MKALPILMENSPMLEILASDAVIHGKSPFRKTLRAIRSPNRRRVTPKTQGVEVNAKKVQSWNDTRYIVPEALK
jgi:hypothetical protein